MGGNIHISLAAEEVFNFLGFPITNSFLVTILVSIVLIIFALWFKKECSKTPPNKFCLFVEMVIEGLLGFFKQIAGEKAKAFFPLLTTFLIFITLSNWTGLLPGVGSVGFTVEEHGQKAFIPLFRGPTADLNTTLALALITIGATQYFSVKFLGLSGYVSRFFNFKNPILLFVGLLEIISELAKILSFSFRLFGNIFAGEVLLAVMGFLVPFLAPLPFLMLETFVGFIQALVFTMLSLVFMSVATAEHVNHSNHENNHQPQEV